MVRPHWVGRERQHLNADADVCCCCCCHSQCRAAYGAWRSEYADVSGPLLARTLAAWRDVRAFLAAHCPRILETLAPGASTAEVAEAEAVLGHPLPQAMRCIYRCCQWLRGWWGIRLLCDVAEPS